MFVLISYLTVFPSGVDVQDTEVDCATEATTPNSFEPLDQTQTIASEPDQSALEEVSPVEEAVGLVEEDRPQKEEQEEEEASGTATEVAPPNEERDSKKEEEPVRDSGTRSTDELLADWREDLEAFKQMEQDEL